MFVLLLLDKRGDVFLERFKSDERTKAAVALLEYVWVFEVMFELGCSLDACIADLADLDWIELIPFALMKLIVEVNDELGVYEVEEGVSHVAIVLR